MSNKASNIANKAAEEGDLPEACVKCNGTGMADDGEIDCYPNGDPYINGPIKCVKDCPECTPIAADRAARAGAFEDVDIQRLQNAVDAYIDENSKETGWSNVLLHHLGKELSLAADAYTLKKLLSLVRFAPSAPVGAVPSIDTPEFRELLAYVQGWSDCAPIMSIDSPIGFASHKLIAHIDQHVASHMRVTGENT